MRRCDRATVAVDMLGLVGAVEAMLTALPATAPPARPPVTVTTAVPPAMPSPPDAKLPPPSAARPAEDAAAPDKVPPATPNPAALTAAPIAGAQANASPPVATVATAAAPIAHAPLLSEMKSVASLIAPTTTSTDETNPSRNDITAPSWLHRFSHTSWLPPIAPYLDCSQPP